MMRRCPNCGHRLIPKPAKKPKQSFWRGAHQYLAGVHAHTQRRREIFANAGGETTWFDQSDPATVEEIQPANCQGCTEPHLVGWNEGHWHHNCELRKKCDAAACAMFVCPTAHRLIHGRFIKWTQRAAKSTT